jgi:peptidoglycan hydrolase CwlO-like protein
MSDYKALYEKQLEENKKLKEKLQSFMGKAKLWETTAQNIEEKNTDLQEQIDELGTLCKNIDENAYNSWKEITEEESEAEEDKYDGECSVEC